MESIKRFITQKLKLKVNEAKSAVARPQERKFLGFSFTAGPDVRRKIAPNALERFKRRIREITRRAKGVSIKTTMEELALYMRGWRGYFGFCETPAVLIALTRWVRRRLRAALWRQWKTTRRRRAALAWISTDWNPSNAGFGKGFRRLRISALSVIRYGELIRRVHAVSFASATILGESGAPRFRCIDLRRMPASWRSQVSWFNSRLTPDMANDTAHMCLSDHYMN